MLRATLETRRGTFTLAVELAADPGAPLVVVGESGAGKTTLLRLLAGLDWPTSGRISLDAEVWYDGRAATRRPAWERQVGYVAQDYALFPHLTAVDNVAFGLRAAGQRASAARARAREQLVRLGVGDLVERRPAQLSGGQQQRVALARALVREPRLLLLDEPLAALDAKTRGSARAEIRELVRGLSCVTVYVTHHPTDALVLGDRVVVLEGGRITQSGSRDDLLRHPRSAYVAALLGTNLFTGVVVERGNGVARVRTPDGMLEVADPGDVRTVMVTVNPRDITLYTAPPTASARNQIRGRIVELSPQPPDGERVRVVLDSTPPLVAEVTRAAVVGLGLAEGQDVFAGFKATGVTPADA
jgi:molybdate transport system ATP-binding protein